MFKEYEQGKITYREACQARFNYAKEYQKKITFKVFKSFDMFDSSYLNDVCPSFMLNSNDGQVTQENDIRFWIANSEFDNSEQEQYNTHMIYLSGVTGENVLLFETTDIHVFYSVIKSNLKTFEAIQREVRK
jgi:hypothetical protein